METIKKEEEHLTLIIGVNFIISKRHTITLRRAIKSINDDSKVKIGEYDVTNEGGLWIEIVT